MSADVLPGRCTTEVVIEGFEVPVDVFRTIDADNSAEQAKTTSGRLYGYYLYNASTSTRYVKLYDSAAAVVGTTTPWMTIPLPPVSGANVWFTGGIPFDEGLGVGATTAIADNSTADPSANEVIANLFYI